MPTCAATADSIGVMKPPASMRVLLVDDHALFRAGMRLLLEAIRSDLIVLDAGTIEQALALMQEHPDIRLCLLDLDLKQVRGLTTLRRVRAVAPAMAVVVISANDDPAIVRECIDQGAMSYIPKCATPEQLTRALARVLAGEVFLPRAEATATYGSTTRREAALTPRQREVLAGLNRGLPTKLIARELGLSEFTVKEYLSDIFRSLGVHNRTEAVIRASQMTLRQSPLLSE